MKYQVKQSNVRLDNYLSSVLEVSRSQVTKMIKAKEVLVNGNIVKPGFILNEGDILEVNHVIEDGVKPEKMNLDIVYEDDDVMVINKANGVVVHPGAGNHSGSLVIGLLYHTILSDLIGDVMQGIVVIIVYYSTVLLMFAI